MSEEGVGIDEDDEVNNAGDDGSSFSASNDSNGADATPDTDEGAISDSAIVAKEKERERIQAEIAEFLSRGGEITTVESNVMTDPPRRPASNYGGQPI